MVLKYSSPVARTDRASRWMSCGEGSPSRQLQFELERALEQLAIHDSELRKVHAYERRTFQDELEARDAARTKADLQQIEAATKRHEAVRREAEAVLQQHLKEQDEERQRKEQHEKERLVRETRERAERERKAKEEAERRTREKEAERRTQEEEARRLSEEARQKKVAEELARAETARKQQEAQAERDRDAREKTAKAAAEKDDVERRAAAKAQAQAQAQADKETAQKQLVQKQAAPVATSQPPGSRFYSSSPEAESQHREHLALHGKLKKFRADFWEQAKKDKTFKSKVGDMRRLIRASVGQQSLSDKANNRLVTQKIKATLLEAFNQFPSPPVPLNDFLPPHQHVSDNSITIPSLLVYLVNILSKSIISAYTTECVADTRAAEALGTMTAQIFSMPEFQFPRAPNAQPPTTSLIPILMAKYHKVAPILFGVAGPEDTPGGRARIGWRIEDSPDSSSSPKRFVHDVKHYERMNALGAGYASIALRNFSKARFTNPFPPSHFWTSLASIANTPPEYVTPSHLLLLKSMLENNAVDRFLLFFGSVGVAALRSALVEFPVRLEDKLRNSSAARGVALMVEGWEKEKHFRLN